MYNAALKDFLRQPSAVVRDEIVEACHGTVLDTALDAWKGEIALLQSCLKCWENEDAHILFEYDIPRLGKRIDVVLLLRGIVFCLEFKVGQKDALQADVEQVLDYALGLKNFDSSHILAELCGLYGAKAQMLCVFAFGKCCQCEDVANFQFNKRICSRLTSLT